MHTNNASPTHCSLFRYVINGNQLHKSLNLAAKGGGLGQPPPRTDKNYEQGGYHDGHEGFNPLTPLPIRKLAAVA